MLVAKMMASTLGPVSWIFASVVGAFTMFVGVTLAVALISNGPRGRRAHKILQDLLKLFRRGGR